MSERSVETDTSRGKTARTAGTGRVREPGVPENNVRFVTAASLFDGHDASINIIRRLLQRSGAEVIHLGHNRSVHEIVNCAIEEDVQGIAVSSYQGGHMEYFTYMIDLLKKRGAPGIRVFGGGGGVIADHEISDLHEYGVTRIFSVDDGSEMGLQGMINYMIRECDFDPAEGTQIGFRGMETSDRGAVARAITTLENGHDELLRFSEGRLSAGDGKELIDLRRTKSGKMPLVGLTGTGGAGKSSLTDELVRRFLTEFETMRIGIISIDPSNVRRGGALLGDRIRMNSIDTDRVFMRSMATRSADSSVSDAVRGAVAVYQSAGFDLVIVETSGIGQSDTSIAGLVDIPIYVMTHEYGAATQLEKINMLELADFVVLNKFDKKESLDALRDIRKQVRRNRGAWHDKPESMPVYPTIASRFNDEGVNRLFKAVTDRINDLYGLQLRPRLFTNAEPAPDIQFRAIIPGKRQRYLSEIADAVRDYHAWAEEQASAASKLEQVEGTIRQLENTDADAGRELNQQLLDLKDHWSGRLDGISRNILDNWETLTEKYSRDVLAGKIRNRTTENRLYSTSLSGTRIPRVSLPKTTHRGERLRFALKENLPGYFPYT
ncbi:MAG: cobalamin-dependent protein, partial [Balneolaceae bacterium]